MELTLPIIAVPAAIALILKMGVYAYTRLSRLTATTETRLYLLFLLSLTIQNIAEIRVFYAANIEDVMPSLAVKTFYASMTVAIGFLFNLAAHLSVPERSWMNRSLPMLVYGWSVLLTLMLYFSSWLIRDFEILDYGIGYSVTRVPGPLYFLFEVYALGGFAGVIAMSAYGWKKQSSVQQRAKNLVLLIAAAPMAGLVALVLILLRFDIKLMNASLTFPIAITYFLIVTVYGIYHRRFFDPQSDMQEVCALRTELAEAQKQLDTFRKQLTHQSINTDGAQHGAGELFAMEKTLEEYVAELESNLIGRALKYCNGNKAKAARALGLRPNTLHYKIERYGLLRKTD